jgi:GWxTD domain-containing protein
MECGVMQSWRVMVAAMGVTVAAAGCARGPRVGPDGAPEPAAAADQTRREDVGGLGDATRVYQTMGLLASAGPVAFVGSVAYLAGPTADTTLALVTLSLANRSLTFTRDGDRFRAGYEVQLDLRQGSGVVRHVEARETVHVPSFRETSRGDESVIFQQQLSVPPGQYVLAFAVRDAVGGKSATQEALVTAPRFTAGTLSSPITVLEVTPRASTDSLPRLVASPRSTVAFGRDSLVPVYLEGYGPGTALPVAVAVRSDQGGPLWTDTVSLQRRGALFSGVINVPVSQLGVGVMTLVAWRGDSAGVRDTARAPVFVSFGDELPVANFDEMLSYLRFFTTPQRLAALRAVPPTQRATAWATFAQETDPAPSTPQHEGLRDYFARIRTANARFREEGTAGWVTDRGMVLVSLGEPDQLYEQGGADVNQRGRAQVWEYRQHRLQLVFVDQTGFGRWRLTTSSDADLQAVLRRIQTR